ncbi:MAG: hypothetical protein LKK46_00920 [Ancrocorticia sp.]|jgi:hypothetical protein|nr:hypothetical protein [Ancrocorticia sp.]MCI2192687.1 hypothetical protein [Ancrocorticia sp.]
MRKIMQSLQVIAALSLLGIFVIGAWYFARGAIQWFGQLDTATRTGILTLFGVVSVPLITFGTQLYVAKKQSREEAIRDKRTAFYNKVVQLFIRMMANVKEPQSPQLEDQKQMFHEVYAEMLTYASPQFIKVWNQGMSAFRSAGAAASSPQGGTGSDAAVFLQMAAFESILIEMRKDLGHKVKDDDFGQLISIIVNDLVAEKQRLLKEDHKKQKRSWQAVVN